MIKGDQSLTGNDVDRVLTIITRKRNQIPIRIQADKGPEFVLLVLNKRAYENNVTLDYSRPGKPTDNPFIESYN